MNFLKSYKFLLLLAIVVAAVVLFPKPSYKSVSTSEFSKLMESPESFLLDVHIPEQAHIPGTDAFIPYNEIADRIAELPSDKTTPILVYCRSGSMSKEAATELAKEGYTNVYDLEGGVDAFRESNASVQITPVSIDLGEVVYGDVAKAEFTFTNFTPAPLKITRVATSCGCTTAEMAEEKLDPYSATVLTVSFDPAFHKDDTDLGELTRTIYVDTDNPNFPQVTAAIAANVLKN